MFDRDRAFAGQLIAAVAVVLSLLVGEPLIQGEIGVLGWLGLSTFTAAGATWFAIVWPQTVLERAAGLLGTWRWRRPQLQPHDPRLIQLAVAEHLEAAYQRNEDVIARVGFLLRLEAILLLFAVVCWVAELATKG